MKASRDNAELNAVADGFTGVQCSASIQVHANTACKAVMLHLVGVLHYLLEPSSVAGYQAPALRT